MTEPVREALRATGQEVLADLQHGTVPPRARPLYLGSIPGMDWFNSEALWGSVWGRAGLTRRLRLLSTISILSSLQRLQQLRTYYNSALNTGIDPRSLREVVIQCSVYAGFPTTVNSLELLRDVLEIRGLEAEDMDVPEATIAELDERGDALAEMLIGGPRSRIGGGGGLGGDPISAAAGALWQVEKRYVFGELYQRPWLDVRERTVCALSSLLALGREDELARWLRGAANAGLSRLEVAETLLHGAYYAGFPAARRALEIAAEVL